MVAVDRRNRDDQHPGAERRRGVLALRPKQAFAVPTGGCETLRELVDARQQLRHLLEHDERRGARKRIPAVRVRVDVLDAELPHLLELSPHEQRRREREAPAERLADTKDVCNVRAWPHLADAAERGEDRVDDEQRARFVAPLPQHREEVVRRDTRTGAALNGLDDHHAGVRRQLAGIVAVGTAMYRAREPGLERPAKAFQAGCR